jgi:hypothetical protein
MEDELRIFICSITRITYEYCDIPDQYMGAQCRSVLLIYPIIDCLDPRLLLNNINNILIIIGVSALCSKIITDFYASLI